MPIAYTDNTLLLEGQMVSFYTLWQDKKSAAAFYTCFFYDSAH